MKRLIVIDDHKMVAEGIALILSKKYEVKSAYTFEQLETLLSHEKWDMAMLDIGMQDSVPDICFLELLMRWNVPVLAVSGLESDAVILQYLQVGAAGIFRKREDVHILIEAIEAVLNGKRWIPQELTPYLAASLAKVVLSERELDILGYFAIMPPPGNKEIARLEQVSVNAIRGLIAKLRQDLGASNRYELRERALELRVPLRCLRIEDLRRKEKAHLAASI